MSNGTIRIVDAPYDPEGGSGSGGGGPLAVAEIVSLGESDVAVQSYPVVSGRPGVGIAVPEGTYAVRLVYPDGHVQSEQVTVPQRGTVQVTMSPPSAPRGWLASAAGFGFVERLPNQGVVAAIDEAAALSINEADDELSSVVGRPLEWSRSGFPAVQESITKSIASSLRRQVRAIGRISGSHRTATTSGVAIASAIDPKRAWLVSPERDTDTDASTEPSRDATGAQAVAAWWVGSPTGGRRTLEIGERDQRNVQLRLTPDEEPPAPGTSPQRWFAQVESPMRETFLAVLPAGWRATDPLRQGEAVDVSVLLTVVPTVTMTRGRSPREAAQWRCAVEVDDPTIMSMLGFLDSGRASAAQAVLREAETALFEKMNNPVAAAAGAFTLLEAGEPLEASRRWMPWIRRLDESFPSLPDGAIARACMELRYGDPEANGAVDVEAVRRYALEAITRGMPYLRVGVSILTDVLLAVTGDDIEHRRRGNAVAQTRRGLDLVRQLSAEMVHGGFFPVLRHLAKKEG